MHIWSLNGLGPIGGLAFGYIAQVRGLEFSLQLGGAIVFAAALWAWLLTKNIHGVDAAESFQGMTPQVSQP